MNTDTTQRPPSHYKLLDAKDHAAYQLKTKDTKAYADAMWDALVEYQKLNSQNTVHKTELFAKTQLILEEYLKFSSKP